MRRMIALKDRRPTNHANERTHERAIKIRNINFFYLHLTFSLSFLLNARRSEPRNWRSICECSVVTLAVFHAMFWQAL